jgi:hypothetical protein
LLLILQVIFDKWITWFLFLLFSIALSCITVYRTYYSDAYPAGDNPVSPEFEMILDVIASSLICLLFLTLLYVIMPEYNERGKKKVPPHEGTSNISLN